MTGSLDRLKPGSKVGDWTILEAPRVMKSRIRCQCGCGSVQAISAENLIRGRSKRCKSCVAKLRVAPKYGEPVRGSDYERMYWIWVKMKDRCNNPNGPGAHLYCLRGITVCPEWQNDFAAFRDWSLANGYRDDLTIDRWPDQNGNYEPGNCRWATWEQQARNRRGNRLLTAFGITKTLIEWSEDPRCVVSRSALRGRVDGGWPLETALRTPYVAADAIRADKTKGSGNGNARLSADLVRSIRELCAAGLPQVQVAERFNIAQCTVSAIHRRKLWGWLP